MQNLLDTAHTWFLDSIAHELSGAPSIRLVEGLKGGERQFVEIGEASLLGLKVKHILKNKHAGRVC